MVVVGFIAYATGNATLNLAGLFYGTPILLGGLALKASEIKPTPFSQATSPEILALREAQATDTQNQIRLDVTRYRYGQEAHLDESLERVGLSPTDEERPLLVALHEEDISGSYALVLEFESPLINLDTWQERREKIQTFFGPGIQAKISQPEEEKVEVALVTDREEG